MSETTNRSIRIEYIGTTTYATVDEAQHVAGPRQHVHLVCRHGAAYLAEGDTFDPYEGARIALARAFGRNPFPVKAEKPEPGQKWRPVTRATELREGDLIRTTRGYQGETRYAPGTIGTYVRTENGFPGIIYVKFNGFSYACGVDLDVEKPEFLRDEARSQGAKPASFCVGDVVKLADDLYFDDTCRGCNAVIYEHNSDTGLLYLEIRRPKRTANNRRVQLCDRDHYDKLTLVYRKENN